MQILLTKALLFFFLLYPNSETLKSDEVLISDVEFVNGLYTLDDRLINGEIIDYYENEKLKFRYRVLEGRLHGLATEFYNDGSVKSEKKYTFNKLFGTFKEYFENGALKAQFNVGLNAYGAGEKVTEVKIASAKNKKLKSKDDGVIHFVEENKNIDKTSEALSILSQSDYKIINEKGKVIFKN